MELTNDFRVGVSVPEAWKVLTDVERIAPMLPGAQLQEIDGEEYRGIVKVKVGPISAQYKGQAVFVERDEDAGRVVLRASGRDARGQGNASAVITATMTPDGDSTKVSVVTDLTITGKVAQFGRGVLAEVSAKLIGQFVDALHQDLADSAGANSEGKATAAQSPSGAPGEAPSAGSSAGNGTGPEGAVTAEANGATTASGPRRIESPAPEPVDLLSVAGGSTLKRLAPVVGVVLVLIVVRARRRGRRARAAAGHLGRMRANLLSVPDQVSNLPSVSDLAGHLPSVSDLAGHLPTVSEVAGHLPTVSEVAGHLPSVSDLAGHLPLVSDLAGRLPSVSEVAGHLPSVSDLATSLPSVSEITSHLSDVRVPHVRAAVRRRPRRRLFD